MKWVKQLYKLLSKQTMSEEFVEKFIKNPTMANAIRAHRVICLERDEKILKKPLADKYLDQIYKWIAEENKKFCGDK